MTNQTTNGPTPTTSQSPKDWRGVVVVVAAIVAVSFFVFLARGTDAFLGVLMGAVGIVGGLLGHQQTSRNYERMIPPGSTISPPPNFPSGPPNPEKRLPLPSSPGVSIPPTSNDKDP